MLACITAVIAGQIIGLLVIAFVIHKLMSRYFDKIDDSFKALAVDFSRSKIYHEKADPVEKQPELFIKNKKHTLRYHRKGPYIYIRQPFIKDFMASTKTTVDQLAQHANVSTKHMYAVLNNTKHVGTHVLRAFQKLFADFDEDEVFYTTNAPGTQSGKTYQLQHGFKKSWKQQWQKRQ